MGKWIVYSKDGRTERCSVKELEYSGSWMGECSVSVTVDSPVPVEFEIGDYLVYRGERFEINYDPTVVKSASVYTSSDGFRYEGVKFNSLSDELTRCDFLDYVPSDNLIHYSSLPNFSFFADSVKSLAERIQVNLDRVYTGSRKWAVEIAEGYERKKNVNISASNMTCWDALALVKSQFGANFIIKNRTITIGTEGFVIEKMFSYGKGNGLVVIEKNAETDQKIVTRLRAYGSTKNMPVRYYFNQGEGIVPNNLAVQNLMLPSFPTETLDPYIDSKNISALGVREGTVFFDGSGEQEEIYPSMEGMTAEELKAAGISVNATGALDEVVSTEAIEDDGIIPDEGELKGTFKMSIKDIGFDINEHLSTEGATISMKNGMCGGREFEIVECKKTDEGYELTCNRSEDTGLGLVFPYKDYPIKAGDKFVLLNIEMPDVYIKAASQRLLEAAREYLAKNDYVRYSYTPKLDSIFLARQNDEAVKKGQKSIYANIKEGDLLMFEDVDLGIEGSVIIDTLSIKESEDLIPEFEVTLRNDKAVGTIEKIQNQIDSIVSGSTAIAGGGSGGGYNSSQIKSIVKAVGETLFLSKTKDDRTPYSLGVGKSLSVGEDLEVEGSASIGGEIKSDDFVAGDLMGSGWSIYRDSNGNTVVETDRIVVRQSLEATELVVNQETFEKGSNIFVKGGCTITKVEVVNGKYRCYYDNEEGRRFSGFKVGDQARCQRYSESYGGVIKYYWRLVTSVEEDYVELSMTDCNGTGIPEEGDDIAQLGSRYDKTRQSAIVISPDNGGSVIVWAGIDSFSLTEKNMVGMGVNPNTGRAYLYGYGDMYFGDRSLEKNYITYQTRDGETEPTLNISADIHFGKGSDGLSNLSEFKDIQGDVDSLFNQIEREFTIWYYDYVPTLDNEPAVNWVSDSDKALHDQDIFFSDKLARAWRFVNGAWVEITDERTLSALKLAEDAQVAAEEAKKNAREAKEYIDNVLPYKLEDLQNQIDGAIESFFYKYNPTTSNEPASLWTTEEQKSMHLNDTFTNLESGYSWRWTKNGNVYGWTEISDTATVKALVAAGQAQDTADQKRRVFVKTPYTPYDEGDLWVQGETGDIMRCLKSRASGNFVSSDWVKASKYTDNSALEAFIQGDYKNQLASIQSQMDKRAETWYQVEDPSLAWTTQELKQLHAGDLWYNINKGLSYMWNGSSWVIQGTPDEVYDTIDGKASIYTSQPSSYKKNDLWVLTSDTTLDKSYKSGTIVVAKQDSSTFVASNWTKLDRYTDDTKAEESIKKISDIEYIKSAFGKDERVMDGGILVSKLVSVQNSSGNIEAFINGSDYAKDSVHGKLIIAGGIPENGSSLEERSRNALTRIYEDGTIISDNVKVKGEVNATSGTFDNVHINGTIRTKWDSLKYKVLYYSSNSVEQWGFDGSAIYSDKIILNGGIGSPELLMAWGDDADGREIAICNKCTGVVSGTEVGIAVKVKVPTGKYIVDLDGTKTSNGSTFNIGGKKIYYMVGFNEGWYVTNILNL